MKDMWSWLYDNDDDEAVLSSVNALMDAYERKDTEAVRASCEELIHLGRAENRPWLEVFARHWQLQHRLLDRREGETAVADAVEAFEIAHRDENLGCPQAVCSTQDLCIAYGVADGPGHAEAIIAACEDTLDRIDSTWPCFDCVNSELIHGLMNARRFDEVIERTGETEVIIRQTGANPSLVHLSNRVEALLELGRDDEAVDVAVTADERRYEVEAEYSRFIYRHQQARALLRKGDVNGAAELFGQCPSPLGEPSTASSWTAAVEELMDVGVVMNDDDLGATSVHLAHLLEARGARRTAFDVAAFSARAAAARGAKGSARRGRALAERIQRGLVDPTMVDDALVAIDRTISAMPSEVADDAPLDRLVDDLEARTDTGALLDPAELQQLIDVLQRQGWDDAAEGLLRAQWEVEPDGPWSLLLIDLLLSRGECDAVSEIASHIESEQPLDAAWVRARVAAREGRWVDVTDHCAGIVEMEPGAMNTRRLWTTASRQLGDFGTAARLATELLDGWSADDPEQPSPDLWLAVVCGTLAADWPLARRAADGIGFNLSGDHGPIEEAWESCFVTFVSDDGQDQTLQAQRTGPATARIVQVSGLNQAQRVGDLVVFEPTPLDPLSADEEAERFTPVRYEVIVTVEAAGASAFPIEGPTPSDEQWPALRDAVFAAGFSVWAYDGGTCQLDGETVPYLYAMVSFGPHQSARELAELLDRLTSDWVPKPFWVQLAEAADDGVDEQKRREDLIWN